MSSHAPSVHSVHIYAESSALIERLCGIVSSSLQIGDAVLIVATAEHRDQLVKELQIRGVDVRTQAREGRFTMMDA
jgi:KaiC/GvpD/RAD55 family RecA-like ATPase